MPLRTFEQTISARLSAHLTRLQKREYVPQSNTPFRFTELMCVWGGLLEYWRNQGHIRDTSETLSRNTIRKKYIAHVLVVRYNREWLSTIMDAMFWATFWHILNMFAVQASHFRVKSLWPFWAFFPRLILKRTFWGHIILLYHLKDSKALYYSYNSVKVHCKLPRELLHSHETSSTSEKACEHLTRIQSDQEQDKSGHFYLFIVLWRIFR